MNRMRLETRLRSMQYYVEVSKFLTSFPVLVETQLGVPKDVNDVRLEEMRLARAHVNHFLNAVAFELGIKILWEISKRKSCKYTHDILFLYSELPDTVQGELEAIYDRHRSDISHIEGTRADGEPASLAEIVDFQSIDEALGANEDVIKNFKYEPEFDDNCTIMGSLIWNGEVLYVMPPSSMKIFTESLFEYTKNALSTAT